jgi:ribosomal protein S21
MPEVIIHDDESFERALKRRKKRKMNAARRKNRRPRLV